MNRTLVAFALAGALALPARADISFQLNHVGRLLDENDQPVTKLVDMTFRLYSLSNKVNNEPPATWTGTYKVQVTNGNYSVMLGSGDSPLTATSFPPGSERYLEVSIGDAALLPRLQVGTVPLAVNAQLIGGHAASELVLATDLTTGYYGKADIDTKFAGIDTKFAAVDTKFAGVDTRFSAVDTRFSAVDTKFTANDTKLAAHDAALALKADASTVAALDQATYKATEIDAALALKAGAAALTALDQNTYKKAEIDQKLALKADASALTTLSQNTYAKTDVDQRLSLKADATALAALDQNTYKKLESDAKLALKADTTAVDAKVANYVPLAGGAITGSLTVAQNFNVTNGKLGVGVASPVTALAVNGAVKLGNDAGTCDSTRAGAMRWTGTNFEACTGSAWVAFATTADTSWMLTTDNCGGFRQSVYSSRVRFAVSNSTTWDKTKRYDCPAGYHWASTAEGQAIYGSNSNTSGVYAYYSQCGWSGYTWAGQARYYFRFSDSASTNAYKHAGNYDEYQIQTDSSTTNFAGIICLAN